MTTTEEFVRRAAWFPVDARARAGSGGEGPALAINGFLSSILPLEDQAALREINVRLTALAIGQCGAAGVPANQVDYGTQACVALAELAAHGVSDEELLGLARDHDVVFPWSLQYGNARMPFNLRLVRLPLALVFPRTVGEVAFWVRWVDDHDLSVSIRSGNNSYEGLSSSNQVVMDLTFLTLGDEDDPQFRIDTDQGVVHVAPAVRLGVLYTELDRAGLAFPGGQCAPVCAGGLVGTGGVGFSTRGFGYACDQLVEVECVLADGSVVVANAGNEHADLYRACKGAGAAGLCVMTRLTLRVQPAGRVLLYTVSFDLAEGAGALAAWQNLATTAPETFSSIASGMAATDGNGMLTMIGELRVEEDDDAADAEAGLRELLQTEWFDRLPVPTRPEVVIVEVGTAEAAAAVAMIVPMPTYNQWKLWSRFTFRSLTADELAPVFDYLRTAPSDDPTRAVGFLNPLLMGGASNRIDPESAVVPAREGAVMWVHAGALWNDPAVEAEALAWTRGLWEVLERVLGSSTAFYVCPELELGSQLTDPPDLRYVHAYWSSPTHDFVPFLVDVKNRYDPTDLFGFAQSIPLALEGS